MTMMAIINNYLFPFLIVVFTVSMVSLIYSVSLYITGKTKMKKYKIDMYLDLGFDEIDEMIDHYISAIFVSYTLLNGYEIKDNRITQEEEIKMNKDVGKLVTDRMAKNLYDRICLFYREDQISNILSEKVCILIMSYILNHNEMVQELQDARTEDHRTNKK